MGTADSKKNKTWSCFKKNAYSLRYDKQEAGTETSFDDATLTLVNTR